jgi:hypothetical protein
MCVSRCALRVAARYRYQIANGFTKQFRVAGGEFDGNPCC